MTILVTGSSQGVGDALADHLVALGHSVVGVHRGKRPTPPGRSDIVADLATDAGVAIVVAGCSQLTGVVLNAGAVIDGSFESVGPPDPIDLHLAVNLAAPLKLLRGLLRAGAIEPHASVVLVSSNLARHGLAGRVSYGAAKAGVEGAVRGLARELGPAPRHIRVNAVAPGLLRTAMSAARPNAELADYAAEVPLGRVGRPLDVARVIGFLLGDGAGYMTGQILDVDGGWGC